MIQCTHVFVLMNSEAFLTLFKMSLFKLAKPFFCFKSISYKANSFLLIKSNSIINSQFNKDFSDKAETLQELQYESVVGIEIHAQIASESKLFSSASTNYYSAPNDQVALFDVALPGTLPVLNRRAVEAAIMCGLALNCDISLKSSFDRKHYFYADLPAGYQITQQREPLAKNGYLDFVVYRDENNTYMKRSKVKQIQIEQDSGKSLIDLKNHRSLVDFNRAGVALLEFVFEPDLVDGVEASCLVKEMIMTLRRIGACTCRMHEGALRVDANISVRLPGELLGTRTEVKNMNSTRWIASSIDHEINRQIDTLRGGGRIINETRMYDQKSKQTVPMRDKEVAQDYRFMREPNLPPILLTDSEDNSSDLINIWSIQKELPDLPRSNRQKLLTDYNLSLSQIFLIMTHDTGDLLKLYETLLDNFFLDAPLAIFAANFLLNEVGTVLEEKKKKFSIFSDWEDSLVLIIKRLFERQITLEAANKVILIKIGGRDPRSAIEIINEKKWFVSDDKVLLATLCQKAIETHAKPARRYKRSGIRKPQSIFVTYVKKYSNYVFHEDEIWQEIDKILKEKDDIKS